MFQFQQNVPVLTVVGIWLAVFAGLFLFNEIARRWKWAGFFSFVVLPIGLSIVWFTALKDQTYTDWFHLMKVYSATIGSLGFWCIRHIEKKNKLTGEVTWRLADQKWALVFAAPATTQATNITTEQLVDIYSGKLLNWPDGSALRPVLRQPGDDNTRQVRNISPALDSALSIAEQRPGMLFAMTDQEAVSKIENTSGALGVTTLALIISENRQVRALTLDGVEPTVTNAVSGSYPHYKRLFLITLSEPSAAVQRFIAFIQSPAGREILTQTGHWTP